MHIKNSGISEYSGGVAHIGHRQIYRFDYFESGKFGYSDKQSKIALCFCTYLYANRWQADSGSEYVKIILYKLK